MELETPIASTDGQCCGAGVWEGGAEIISIETYWYFLYYNF